MGFKGIYEVDDGYIGDSRPQYFTIDVDDIEDDMDEEALRELFYQAMEEDFQQRISCYSININKFVEWAQEMQRERAEED